MKLLFELRCNLKQLIKLSKELATKSKKGDIFFLKGELGVGKTAFARGFINSLYEINNISKPTTIKSPSFPIMISYNLKDYEIFHYDFYRIINKIEIEELCFFEDFKNNISIIEWPDILLNNFKIDNYFLIEFTLINFNYRLIKVFQKNKKF